MSPRPCTAGLPAALLLSLLLSLGAADARADGSEASTLSGLPVVTLSAAGMALLTTGTSLKVMAVQASGNGTSWLLERVSDGARATLQLSGRSPMGVGTTLLVSAISAGWVLSADGKAIACVPNELGASLLFNERVSR